MLGLQGKTGGLLGKATVKFSSAKKPRGNPRGGGGKEPGFSKASPGNLAKQAQLSSLKLQNPSSVLAGPGRRPGFLYSFLS